MTPEKYKELSIKEFTQAAKIYDSGHAGIYEMCKDDYPPILEELEKETFHDVLDCGCGTGPMIQLLHEKAPAGIETACLFPGHWKRFFPTLHRQKSYPIQNFL